MNKFLYIALFLLVVGALLLWSYRSGIMFSDNKKLSPPAAKVIVAPADQAATIPVDEKNALNLSLPATPMLMDPIITLPKEQHDLKNIFGKAAQDTVSVDARLLIDENPEPNAGVWDTVKGAEVGITIKTP